MVWSVLVSAVSIIMKRSATKYGTVWINNNGLWAIMPLTRGRGTRNEREREREREGEREREIEIERDRERERRRGVIYH